MYVIFGASGKVGASSAAALRKAGKAVRAVVRNPAQGEALARIGCEVAIADLDDLRSIRRALDGAQAAQLICPVALQASDAASAMRAMIHNAAQALSAHPGMRVLAVSDYGAELESGTGITMLYRELERQFAQAVAHLTLLRSAEHMQNWGRVLPVALATGYLSTLHAPASTPFPTVSAHDVGTIAAQLLLEQEQRDDTKVRVVSVEGPHRYSAEDAARLLGEVCGREMRVHVLPRQEWAATLSRSGINEALATLIMETNDAQNSGRIGAEAGTELRRGTTGLREVLAALVAA
ncbi:MAG: NmrA family NAD(P)-binding protein [Herbaspirillum sp.]|nr:NmrA family NAD(P)-binding protein [Herbaspirillum sp.]